MTRSMTAYGRATSKAIEGMTWTVEVHSVNRKGLDIHIYMPKEFLFAEIELRKLLTKEIFRGQVTLKVGLKKTKDKEASLKMLKKLKTFWEKMACDLGYAEEEIDLSFLLEQVERTSFEEFGLTEKKIETELKKTLNEALNGFLKMKIVEGKAISLDIKERLKAILKHLKEIEKKAEDCVEKYRNKLLERLEDVLEGASEDERFLKEVAFFAEKTDITEEITRLESHLDQAGALLTSKEKSIGRTLEFLSQEMLREINTIASKSGDLSVTKHGIWAKAELEKIREQVQNIE